LYSFSIHSFWPCCFSYPIICHYLINPLLDADLLFDDFLVAQSVLPFLNYLVYSFGNTQFEFGGEVMRERGEQGGGCGELLLLLKF
jgi:hypothetical protein